MTSSQFNITHVKFEDPVRHELAGLDRHYYTQALKYHGQDMLVPTEWFQCSGVKENFDKKKEILVPISSTLTSLLKNIETVAINEGLKLPSEFQSNLNNVEVFKHLPEREKLYLKLTHDVACFDKYCKKISLDQMISGEFRVVIHIKGLYIGHHPSSGRLASLQLRVVQIQNIPKVVQCMFSSLSLPQTEKLAVLNAIPPTPQPGTGPMPLAPPAKKGRKPKLQRQNAVIENRIQQQDTQALETLSSDFFSDIDLRI